MHLTCLTPIMPRAPVTEMATLNVMRELLMQRAQPLGHQMPLKVSGHSSRMPLWFLRPPAGHRLDLIPLQHVMILRAQQYMTINS